MGTSQSINPSVRDNPNWSELSRSISLVSRSVSISNTQLQGIMNLFVKAVGGSGAGNGLSSTFGRAGISRAKRFMSFISNVQTEGFNNSLRLIGVTDFENLSVNDFINYLLAYCSEGNSNLDETAANSAMDELLKHILNSLDSIESIENIFQQAGIETQKEWLCFFFASYIVEFKSELFSTRIFENGGDRVRIFHDIRSYILRSLEELDIEIGLQRIDWHGDQGTAIIENLQTEILEIWSQE